MLIVILLYLQIKHTKVKVSNLSILVSKELYLKDPTSSEVGQKILSEGLMLLHESGLEEFTFKKLAFRISTTESTVYRYFENKHQFLFYLFNYYWAWMEYQLILAITNISDPKEKLKKSIQLITKTTNDDPSTLYINEKILQQVIMVESSKTFLSKKVDQENKLGYFQKYKQFVSNISNIILENKPTYPYPQALISTIIESAFHQRFFAIHLPKLTNDASSDEVLEDFFYQMSINTIENYK